MEKFMTLFDKGFFDDNSLFDADLNNLFKPTQLLKKHLYDVYEDNDNLIIEINVAGFKRKEININIDGKILTIDGKRTVKDVKRIHDNLSKQIALKYELENEPDDIEASLSDGILKIVAKPQKQSLKNIEIK